MKLREWDKEQVAEPNQMALNIAEFNDLNENQRLMRDFMAGAGQDVQDVPTLSSREVQATRLRLIGEELKELAEAYEAGDLKAVYDACVDLDYVVSGTFVAHGLNQRAGFIAVHHNNMDKLARGHLDEGGKFIKPDDHLPPDLWAVIDMQYRANPLRAAGDAHSCLFDGCDAKNSDHQQDDIPWEYLTVMCDGGRVKL